MSNNQNIEQKVWALKYRPKRFEDLVGQSTVSQTLSLALDSNRLSHAYLFSGLRGSGKTSTARIMAKALLCSNGPTSRPCEVCENCLSANTNRHIDIIEMDAASNRGIDDIKDLIEHTKYKPSSARFKVFIIDEVHMLTTQAFNALLKTLEEPPGFVKFILATTDPLKLPATILSRTQHFRFNKIANRDVIHHLSHILNEENIDFESPALEILARSGHGSLRDTLTLLDQGIIFSKGKITTTSIVDMLGLIDPELMNKIFEIVLKKGDIIELVKELENYEISQVCDEMTIYLKQKMLEKDAKFNLLLFDRFFRILSDAKHLLSLNSDGGFVLILTLSKMMEATNLKSIDDIISQVENIEVKVTKTELPVQEKIVSENIDKKNEIKESIKEDVNSLTPFEEERQDENINSSSNEEESIEETNPDQENINLYTLLTKKIHERDDHLGELFEKNFIYKSFSNKKLEIISNALGEDRKFLLKHYGTLKMFIYDIFGNDIDIEFVKNEHVEDLAKKHDFQSKKEKPEALEDSNNSTGSMIEDIEMSSTMESIEKKIDSKPAEQELEMNDVLNSPMLNKAKELFDIKKITVKTKN